MSRIIPTSDEITVQVLAGLEATLNQTIPLLPKAFNRVLARVLGAVFVTLYKYGGWIGLQLFVQMASDQETTILGQQVTPLTFWGRFVGTGDPTPGTQAEHTIAVTVTNQVGNLQSGSQMLSSKNGVTYITVGSVALDAAVVYPTVRAVSDQEGGGGIGAIGNLEVGDVLAFVTTPPNVENEATVTAQTVTGADAESTPAYRQRVVDRFQKRPQGGAPADYELWGEEAAGIINVYPYKGDPGVVNVYSEATPESSGSEDGIPTQAQLDSVKALIEYDSTGLAQRRPIGAYVNSLPITRTGYDVEVYGLSGVDDVAATQADIVTGVEQYFWGRAPRIPGLTIDPRADIVSGPSVGGIVQNIAQANGGYISHVIVKKLGTPIALDTLGEGEKAKAATVVFL
jgi:hypothetical protein